MFILHRLPVPLLPFRKVASELFPQARYVRVLHCGKISSTNTCLMEMARKGDKRNLVLIADCQTGGRGRVGRQFYSPAGSGLYMSILLQNPSATPAELTTSAAVAVTEAIRNFTGKPAMIKWVNDIWIDGKKVCGILAEGRFGEKEKTSDCRYAVVGIGVNIAAPKGGFPPELQNIVTSLDLPSDHKARNQLAIEILNRYLSVLRDANPQSHLSAYRQYSCLTGKTVTVYRGNDVPWTGKVIAVTDDYRLSVENECGKTILLDSGEVSVRPEGFPL